MAYTNLTRKLQQIISTIQILYKALKITYKESVVLTAIILQQIERALGVIEKMEVAGIKPNVHTYTIIMGGYAAMGDIGTAFEYFKKIREVGLTVDIFVYELLLKACSKSGRMQSALAFTLLYGSTLCSFPCNF
jgi:pentatricopeptide repeat protein